jgi:outer membrane protein assembly factor BamB
MRRGWLSLALVIGCAAGALAAEEWLQPKFDSKHSGNVPGRTIQTPLGLLGAVALGDAVLTSPVVAAGRVYVVDASGTAFCIDARTFEIVWKFATRGGAANCNNVSSPTLVDGKLHFGTMAGWYYVLDAAMGKLVREMDCGEPIFSAPVASSTRWNRMARSVGSGITSARC